MRPPEWAPEANGHEASLRADSRGEHGLSLIEISIAMVVMVVGMFGLIQAMITSNRLERATDERKLAYAFCNAQIETIRSRRFGELTNLTSATPSGYIIAGTIPGSVNASVSSTLGFKQSSDVDADADRFGRYYSSSSAAANYDPLLAGLGFQSGYTRVAEVVLVDPYAAVTTFTNLGNTPASNLTKPMPGSAPPLPTTGVDTGVAEGEGYWVTVRVFWKGVVGDQEVSMSTFVTAR